MLVECERPVAPGLRRADGTASAARALHLRRQLAAAVDHGAALLPALGLPRLVEAGFEPIDLRAAGDALEAAVAALDALDGDADLEDEGEAEPWLGWTGSIMQSPVNIGGASDLEAVDEDGDELDKGEHDTADAEPWLGAPSGGPDQRRWSQGDSSDREEVNEDGVEDEEHGWRFAHPNAVQIAARACEAAHA